jgi:hypothetical protein
MVGGDFRALKFPKILTVFLLIPVAGFALPSVQQPGTKVTHTLAISHTTAPTTISTLVPTSLTNALPAVVPSMVLTALPPTKDPTITPSPTPAPHDWIERGHSGLIQTSPQPLASTETLQKLVKTLRAEKKITVTLGTASSSEIWRIVYRQPKDCLLTVYTSDMRLVRTIYYRGSHVKIDAGKVKQEFEDQRWDGWSRTLLFLGYNKEHDISEYRQLAPGEWIPNRFGSLSTTKIPGVQHQVRFSAINENVDQEFLNAGAK